MGTVPPVILIAGFASFLLTTQVWLIGTQRSRTVLPSEPLDQAVPQTMPVEVPAKV